MHIGICDDNIQELLSISYLIDSYKKERLYSITYETFNSCVELLDSLELRKFDLLILDIIMPGITGIQAAHEIRTSGNNIPIIFLTSSPEFAVQSYRVAAADYIIKPPQKDIVFETLDRLFENLSPSKEYLTLKSSYDIVKLPLSEIVFIEVVNRTIQFTLSNGHVRESYGYLTDYEKQLSNSLSFYKTHRSYIVNFQYVTELTKSGFSTTVDKFVPVARGTFTNAKSAYMKYLLSGKEGTL